MRRMTGTLRALGQAGDTIVEVMVVLAVLGLSLSFSYATASHGLIQSRNAEEHSQALGLLNSQVELVRQAFAQQTDTSALSSGTDFCMSNPANPANSTPLRHNVPPTAASDSAGNYSEYPGVCVNSYYHESVHYDTSNPSSPFFDFRVRWDGLNNLGPQQEELTYLISTNSVVAGSYDDSQKVVPPPVLIIASPSNESASNGTLIPVTAVVNNMPAGGTFSSFVIRVTDTVTGSVTNVPVRAFGNIGTATVTMGPHTIRLQAAATIVSGGSSTSLTSGVVTITEVLPTISITSPGNETLNNGDYVTVRAAVNNAPAGATYSGCVIKITDTVTGGVTSQTPFFCGSSFTVGYTMGADTVKIQAQATMRAGGITTLTSNPVTLIAANCPWGEKWNGFSCQPISF